MNDSLNHPVFSKPVIEMLTVANEYCLFVEGVEKYAVADIYSYLMKVAPLLYLKGALLPDIEVSDETANERFLTEEAYLSVYKGMADKLGEDVYFKDADSVSTRDSALAEYNLAELLCDVYQDLKDFILLYQKKLIGAKENAVYSCKYLFEKRWGISIILVLKVIHHKLFPISGQFSEI